MREVGKINKTYVSEEEIKQISGMVNWAVDNKNTIGIQIRMFKQFQAKSRIWETKFCVVINEMIDHKHCSAMGDGDNVIEAMTNMLKSKDVMYETAKKLYK